MGGMATPLEFFDSFFVFRVGADPEPDYDISVPNGEGAPAEPHANGKRIGFLPHTFERQTRMIRIPPPQAVILPGDSLDSLRQAGKE
jgi:hypothetical protein